jgi:hypothetical protein
MVTGASTVPPSVGDGVVGAGVRGAGVLIGGATGACTNTGARTGGATGATGAGVTGKLKQSSVLAEVGATTQDDSMLRSCTAEG